MSPLSDQSLLPPLLLQTVLRLQRICSSLSSLFSPIHHPLLSLVHALCHLVPMAHHFSNTLANTLNSLCLLSFCPVHLENPYVGWTNSPLSPWLHLSSLDLLEKAICWNGLVPYLIPRGLTNPQYFSEKHSSPCSKTTISNCLHYH